MCFEAVKEGEGWGCWPPWETRQGCHNHLALPEVVSTSEMFDEKKTNTKQNLEFPWYLSAMGACIHDQMLLVHEKPAWRPWNKWPLTSSAGCEVTCGLYQDGPTRESPLCECSCASKIVLLLVMFIYQQNLSGGRISYVDKSTALLVSCLRSRNALLYFLVFLAKTCDGTMVTDKNACPLFLGSSRPFQRAAQASSAAHALPANKRLSDTI